MCQEHIEKWLKQKCAYPQMTVQWQEIKGYNVSVVEDFQHGRKWKWQIVNKATKKKERSRRYFATDTGATCCFRATR